MLMEKSDEHNIAFSEAVKFSGTRDLFTSDLNRDIPAFRRGNHAVLRDTEPSRVPRKDESGNPRDTLRDEEVGNVARILVGDGGLQVLPVMRDLKNSPVWLKRRVIRDGNSLSNTLDALNGEDVASDGVSDGLSQSV